jgi:hypothetical protein
MRIALLTGWLSENGGGVLEAVFRMAQSLRAMPELELSILGLDHKESAPAKDWKGMSVAALPTRGPSSWGYAPDLARRLAQTMPDLLHVHGLWMFPSVASRRWSRASPSLCRDTAWNARSLGRQEQQMEEECSALGV